jgi:hypothetical protein|tara:strand:+ start:78 stop:872 length:795 start_codon:yes stop_codon:yes gene_type:complete
MNDKYLEELYALMNEKDFDAKLKPKGGGKVVHFTNQDNYEKALKSGDYEEPEADGDDSDDETQSQKITDFERDVDGATITQPGDDEESIPIEDYESYLDSPHDYEDWLDANEKDLNLDAADEEEINDLLKTWKYTEDDLQVAYGSGDEEEEEYLLDTIQNIKDDLKVMTSRYVKSSSSKIKPKQEPKQEPKAEPKAEPKDKTEPATADDSREVRNNVIKNIGQDAFDKLSYGELQQAYEDEFKRLGFTKVPGSGFGLHRFVKKV